MSLSPQEYNQVKAFRDLVKQTVDRLGNASSQGTLAQAAGECADRWREIDPDFARVLTDVGSSVWQMPFTQVRPTVQAIVNHLGGQLADLDAQLAS